MADRILSEEALFSFLDRLLDKLPVMGPMERPDQPKSVIFDWLSSPEDLIAMYTTTTLPPKKAFFPPTERLFRFELSDPPKFDTIIDDSPFVLLGVHPCDLAALEDLDLAYSTPPEDLRWMANRRRATIIGMECQADEYCFCTSVGASRARVPCDLFLTPVPEGYLVEVLTEAGEKLIAPARTLPATETEENAAERWRLERESSIVARIEAPPEEIADILDRGNLTPIWKDVADRCYSCGSCNTTCPTCFCFDIHDDFNLSLRSGTRKRTWDSCQLLEFALVAGGHNFRRKRWQRVRQRWHRKFLHLYRQFGRPFCTGCGRCSRACTADINLADVTNELIAYSRKESANG